MNLGALGLPMSVWLCIHSSSVCSHLSCIGCTSCNWCFWCCKMTSYGKFHLPFACCRSSLWDAQHKTLLIQVIVIEDDCIITFKPVAQLPWQSWYKMATICFLFNSMLSAECEGSVTQSWTASNSLDAPEDTQTSFSFIESYIGSLEAIINSDFINIRL